MIVESVRLRSGRDIVIRPIRPSDGPALKAAHDRLSPQTTYRRFLAPKPHLSSADARYLVDIDGQDHVAFVAVPSDDPQRIVAVARFVRLPEDPAAAEFAIVVGDRFQEDGLGSALVNRLAEAARERGITRFRATLLAENAPAHRLVRGIAGDVTRERHAGPVDEIEVDLAGAGRVGR